MKGSYRGWRLSRPLSPLRLGVDVDGVLAQFDVAAYDKMLAMQTGYRVDAVYTDPVDGVNHPKIWSWFEAYGFARSTKQKFWEDVCGKGAYEFWSNLPLCAGVEQERLTLNLAQTFYVTSRPTVSGHTATPDWLKKHDLRGTLLTVAPGTKGHIANALKLHCVIDDKPENLQDVLTECKMRCVPILIDRPYNRDFEHDYVYRVADLREAFDVLDEIALLNVTVR